MPADAELTPEERADQEPAERRPQSRKSRRNRRRRNGGYVPGQPADTVPQSAPHTWEVPQSTLATPVDAGGVTPGGFARGAEASAAASSPAAGHGQDGQPDGTPDPDLTPKTRQAVAVQPAHAPVPQLWNVEAVDGAGQVLAAWRGIQLRDCGPLPRNAAWPPTLLSVFLERSAVDLGLDEGLRITVSCGQPDWPLPQLLSGVPLQSLPPDSRALAEGRHAGPERRALNTVKAPGVGALAGFGLMLRAPVPVACGWVTVQSGHRQHEPAPGMASAFAQLRAELAEPAAVLTARLNAIGACLQMAHLQPDGSGGSAGQLSVTRTTNDGWAVLALGRAVIACTVVELSGVTAPVAVALLTRQYAHARGIRSRNAAPVAMS